MRPQALQKKPRDGDAMDQPQKIGHVAFIAPVALKPLAALATRASGAGNNLINQMALNVGPGAIHRAEPNILHRRQE